MKKLMEICVVSVMLALPVAAYAQTDPTPNSPVGKDCPMADAGAMQKDMGAMMKDMDDMMSGASDPDMKARMHKMHDQMGAMMSRMQKMGGGMGGMMQDATPK